MNSQNCERNLWLVHYWGFTIKIKNLVILAMKINDLFRYLVDNQRMKYYEEKLNELFNDEIESFRGRRSR